jgi:hypothetical protein
MLKVTGLDKLQKQLSDAQRAFATLDGQITTVSFDPDNPESIQAAIQAMETAVDEKVAPYRGNAMVESIIPQMKEKYRAGIYERAASAKSAPENSEVLE